MIVQNNTEIFRILFTQYPLHGNTFQNGNTISQPHCWQWYMQDLERFHHHQDPSLLLGFYNHTYLPARSNPILFIFFLLFKVKQF